jgi:hypothetical protein
MIAAQMARLAAPQDIIVVHPWYFGLTFDHYYHGAASWTTLPPLSDYRLHRYDLLKEQLAKEHPNGPLLEKVAAALASGHKVWVVGWLPVVRSAELAPADLPPAPNPQTGWYDEPYTRVWGAQLSYLLASHATSAQVLPEPPGWSVNPLENMRVFVFSGWRVALPPKAPSASQMR